LVVKYPLHLSHGDPIKREVKLIRKFFFIKLIIKPLKRSVSFILLRKLSGGRSTKNWPRVSGHHLFLVYLMVAFLPYHVGKIYSIIVVLICLSSCRKEQRFSDLPAATGQPVTVTVDPNHLANAIPSNFEGLSYETWILTKDPDVLNVHNAVLIRLIKNLGAGILRIGGDSSDEVYWTGKERTTQTGPDSLTTTDIDRLAEFSKATGWPVLMGLNLGKYDVSAAAGQADYALTQLKENLYGLSSGNEPDVYHLYGLRNTAYGTVQFQTEWESYQAAIRSKAPKILFTGPGIAYNTDWVINFAENEHTNVEMLDAHYYLTGPATASYITYKTILYPDGKLANYLPSLAGESAKFKLPFRITECNSVYGGGKKGVSDVFASALWALDFMWTIAANKGNGINFHSGTGLHYSPVIFQNGVITAMPEYYAMLAFKFGSRGGTIIPSKILQTSYNCSAYACTTGNQNYSVTLINKSDKDLSFTVQIGKTVGGIDIARLAAPAVTSTTGTTFGGSTVNADGTFNVSYQHYTVNQKSFLVNVPAFSAAVVTVQ
jgi:hypothetical protein